MSQDHPQRLLLRQGTHSSGAHAWTHSRCSAVAGPESHVQCSYEATSSMSGGASSQTPSAVVCLTLALILDLTAHTLVAVRWREDNYETRGKAQHGTTEET